jgi:MFS family permease
MMMAAEGAVGPVLPLYASSLGMGAALVGVVIAAPGFARIILGVPVGSISDSIGRRPLLFVGPLLTATGSLLTGLVHAPWSLVAVRLLVGAGNGTFMTGSLILLSDIADARRRVRAISLYRASVIVGVTAGPLLGGLVAKGAGLRAPFFVVSGLTASAAIWSFRVGPEGRRHAVASASDEAAPRPTLRNRLRLVTGNLDLLLVSVMTFGMFFVLMGSRLSVLPFMARDRIGLDAAGLGGVFALISLFNLLSLWPAAHLGRRIGRKMLIVVSGAVTVLSLVLFAQAHYLAPFLAAAALMGVGTGLASPSTATYAAEAAPVHAMGTAMGLYQMLGDSGFVIGPLVMGTLAATSGFGPALLFNAGLVVVSSVLFAMFAQDQAREPEES